MQVFLTLTSELILKNVNNVQLVTLTYSFKERSSEYYAMAVCGTLSPQTKLFCGHSLLFVTVR